jgi:hypothetical protein
MVSHSLWYIIFFGNTKQFLEAETKLIYIIYLKPFIFKLDNVSLLKYMQILFYHKLLNVMYPTRKETTHRAFATQKKLA